jgi:ADP-ribose pyrophosphatase YjhB (NUDIX family)
LENRPSWAIVGGIIEPTTDNGSALVAAQREVQEEMKLSCAMFQPLGRYRTDVNRGMGWTYPFLAKQCHPIMNDQFSSSSSSSQHKDSTPSGDEVGGYDTERQDLVRMSLDKVKEALLNSEFLEIQWSATVALALLQYSPEG